MANANEPKKRANSAYTFSKMDDKLIFDYGAGLGRIILDPALVSAENRARAVIHGLKQRAIDAAALEAGEDGKTDPASKFARMKRVVDHLNSGATEWNLAAGAGRPAGPDVGLMIRAMIALGIARDVDHANRRIDKTALTKFDGARDAACAALWAAKDIALKVAELRLADQSRRVNADALLDEDLDEEPEDLDEGADPDESIG